MVKFEYPKVKCWNADIKEEDKIRIINEEDFNLEKVLKLLGINNSRLVDSFGITDREEIIRRQNILRLFIERPDIRKFFLKNPLFNKLRIPFGSQEFLDHFNPSKKHNPFWQLLHSLIEKMDFRKDKQKGKNVSKEFNEILDFIETTADKAEEREKSLSGSVANKLSRSVQFNGMVTFRVNGNGSNSRLVKEKVIGYKKYSFGLTGILPKINVPKWTKKKVAEWCFGIGYFLRLVIWFYNWIRGMFFYAPLVITELPIAVEGSLKKFVAKLLLGTYDLNLPSDFFVDIHFYYERDGLHAQVVSVQVDVERENCRVFYGFDYDFEGYSPFTKTKIAVANVNLHNKLIERYRRNYDLKLMNLFEKNVPGSCDGSIILPMTYDMEMECGWYAVKELLTGPALEDFYRGVDDYRSWVREHLLILKDVAEIAEMLLCKVKRWNMPLNFPEITENGEHVFTFNQLYPFHLIGRKKVVNQKGIKPREIRPVRNFPPLNGDRVIIVGPNKSGKTVLNVLFPYTILLAQSGLPNFGEKLRLNIKKILGLVFIEGQGEGSLTELFMYKTMKVMEGIREVPREDIFIVMDEVGTGNQIVIGEEIKDGVEAGLDILFELEACSVVGNTQLYELAERSNKELGVQCLHLDRDYQINEGIGGTGGLDDLMKEVGINKFLSRNRN